MAKALEPSLLIRLATRTGQQPQKLKRLLALPRNTQHGPCLTWTGAHNKQNPVISYEGKVVPVRSLTVGYQSRVHCGNPLCIAPAHCSTHLDRLLGEKPKPLPADDDSQDIREMYEDGVSLENLIAEYGEQAVKRALPQ